MPGGGVNGNPPSSPAWGVPGGNEVLTLPPPPIRGRDVPYIVPVGSMRHLLPGGSITREGNELQHTLGSLCVPSRAGHGSDPGGVEPTPPALTQVWHVFHMAGSQ